jgi:hypothetical protein
MFRVYIQMQQQGPGSSTAQRMLRGERECEGNGTAFLHSEMHSVPVRKGGWRELDQSEVVSFDPENHLVCCSFVHYRHLDGSKYTIDTSSM